MRLAILAKLTDDPATGCWIFAGATSGRSGKRQQHGGYGQTRVAGRNLYVHRVAFEAYMGPIPSGLVVDHLCRRQACCNPAHLEAVNLRRGNHHWETR